MSAALKTPDILRPADLIRQVVDLKQPHVCQKPGWLYDKEIKSVEVISSNAESYFQSPATAILWPMEITSRKESRSLILDRSFSSSREKTKILDETRGALANLTKSSTLIDEVIAVADEFVTNALFNAPFVDPITHKNMRIDRTKTIDLPGPLLPRIFLAEDGQRLLIGCQDPFGSLNVPAYLQRIAKCYTAGVNDAINFGQGGAGIGSYIIFNTGSSLYYGVKPGQMTLLGCVVPHRLSRRQREDMPKHLHWIQTK